MAWFFSNADGLPLSPGHLQAQWSQNKGVLYIHKTGTCKVELSINVLPFYQPFLQELESLIPGKCFERIYANCKSKLNKKSPDAMSVESCHFICIEIAIIKIRPSQDV